MLKKLFICLVLFLLPSSDALGQTLALNEETYSIKFRGLSLELALQEFVKITDADLIYDPSFKMDQEIFLVAQKVSSKELLRLILEDTGFDYIILSSGTFVVVKEVQEKSRFGDIKGIITDSNTGEPVELASIYVAEVGSGTYSNPDGRFVIPQVLQGIYTLTINHTGYKALEVTLDLDELNQQPLGLRLNMEPKVMLGNTVVVQSDHLPLGITSGFQTSEQLSNANFQPTANVVNSLQYFSGASYSIAAQQLSIQGSGASDHVLSLDGVTVYEPYSLSLITSSFSPYAIDQISLSKAGFTVDDGSYLAGKINVDQKYSAAGQKQFSAQVDPIAANITATSPVKLGENEFQLDLTARSSLNDLYTNRPISNMINEWDRLDPLLQNLIMGGEDDIAHYDITEQSNEFSFNDFHITGRQTNSLYSETSFSAYLGGSSIRTDVLSDRSTINSQQPDQVYTREQANYRNALVQVTHRNYSNARLEWSLNGYASTSSYTNAFNMQNEAHFGGSLNSSDLFNELRSNSNMGPDQNRNYINEFGVKSTFNYAITSNNYIEVGVSPKLIRYEFQLDDLFYSPTIEQNEVFQLGSYVQNELRLKENIALVSGLRFTALPNVNVFAEPRASLQIDLPNLSFGYSSIKFSTGLYRQFVNRFEVSNVGPSALISNYNFWLPVSDETAIPQSMHYAFSLNHEFADATNFLFEAYYKDIQRGLHLDYPALFSNENGNNEPIHSQADFLGTHEGFARGFAFSLNRVFANQFYFEGTYQRNISRITIDNQFNGSEIPTRFNEPHHVKLFTRWNISERFDIISNMDWIPTRFWAYRDAYYSFIAQHSQTRFGNFDLSNPGNESLPAFFTINAGVQYARDIQNAKVKFRFDIQNVTNRRNVIEYAISPVINSSQQVDYQRFSRRLPGLLPNFSVEISF